MLSAFGEPPVSGNSRPARAAGAAKERSHERKGQRKQQASAITTFGHEGREYKEARGAFAARSAH